MPPRTLLITGATGKQGSAVIDALLSHPLSSSDPFTVLAVTRNPSSPSALRLQAKSPSTIKLVQANLDDPTTLFASAKASSPTGTIWGVFSVQPFPSKNEVTQGKSLVDHALKNNVRHFVYSSVDRGGDEHSWNNPTEVPHFKSKWEVEQHLRKSATRTMGWTILRPVIFMDNLSPGFAGKVFMTLLRDTLGRDKPLQWIATRDIGFFAAEAFHNPEEWNKKAMGLAGDELTFEEMNRVFERVTGKPVPTTWGLLGKGLKTGVKELGSMAEWFALEGYKADLRKVKEVNPGTVGLEEWLRKSPFVKGK